MWSSWTDAGEFEQARVAGCSGIYWHTHETNATARKLYDKVAELSGFLLYSRNV